METSANPTRVYQFRTRAPADDSHGEVSIEHGGSQKALVMPATIYVDPTNIQSIEEAVVGQDANLSDTLSSKSKSTAIAKIETLPNELLSNIFCYLDIEKPSELALHDEPTFELTQSETRDLKATANVSKRWRSLVIPVLFKNARFISLDPRPERPILNEQITPFLDFAKRHSLGKFITSFTLIILGKKVANTSDGEYRLTSFSTFWYTLFKVIDPLDLLIVAHAAALGALTSCYVFLEDAGNFDCPCHYLRLQRPPTSSIKSTSEIASDHEPSNVGEAWGSVASATDNTSASFSNNSGNTDLAGPSGDASSTSAKPSDDELLEPWELPRAASSTIFEIYPWTALLLNEGSFIIGDFLLRQAPSILADMVGAHEPEHRPFISPTIRDMSYIGIFPMERHFRAFAENLPRLDRLYVQLVPRNGILDMLSRMAKIQIEDLWMERNSCYALIMREIFKSPPSNNYKHLRVFESGDAADRDSWLMAVEFVKRSEVFNGWKIVGDGVFMRDLPPEPKDEGNGDMDSSLSVNQ
ncbi:hypothetical protein BJ875DRAFT_458993 [Amylocarpus encephaloides]|uniref:F-box domain-containing protein n=1 Tax=Amylocarpus encephaloides TaxID=45428 RepID=A0A9P8C6A6_9HELO|nr:hypothetical protein BJ875DRAFT_458993 [Amylocarpus encephaloides]